MKKNIIFLNIILILFLSSCSNILQGNKTSSLSFSLGEEVSEEIIKNIPNKVAITENTTLALEVSFSGIKVPAKIEYPLLKDLANTKIEISKVPCEQEFTVTVKVYYGPGVIFQGTSNKVKLTEETDGLNVPVVISETPSVITLEGYFGPIEGYPKEYTMNSAEIVLPQSLTNDNFDFEGWFTDKNFDAHSEITKIGGSGDFHGSITIYSKWTVNNKNEVTELNATTGDESLTITWKDPSFTENFDHVLVTIGSSSKIIKKGDETAEFTGLKNGTEYTVKAQTVYKVKGQEFSSSGVTTTQYAMRGLTETPNVLKDYPLPNTTPAPFADGTWTYVEFGDWPQKKMEKGVTLSKNTVVVNNWTCYYGSDGYYYVKETATPYDATYKFSDGTQVSKDDTFYFKLEPIQWRVLTNDYQVPDGKNEDGTNKYKPSGTKLLLAEKALDTKCIYELTSNRNIQGKAIAPNNYEYSEVRAYLNGINGSSYNVKNYSANGPAPSFINSAFTPAAIEKIASTEVDNSDATGGPQGNNTTDKIFLLSVKDVTTADYGFDTEGMRDAARKRTGTDYAKAHSIYGTDGSNWWLRTSSTNVSNEVRIVYEDGLAHHTYTNTSDQSSLGIVPALSISF